MVARAVKQVTASRGVEIEEDAGHNNDLFFQTGLEEVEPVGDAFGEAVEVEPPGFPSVSPTFTLVVKGGGQATRKTYR